MLGPTDQPLESMEKLTHMTQWAPSEIKEQQTEAEIRTGRRGSKGSHKGGLLLQKATEWVS